MSMIYLSFDKVISIYIFNKKKHLHLISASSVSEFTLKERKKKKGIDLFSQYRYYHSRLLNQFLNHAEITLLLVFTAISCILKHVVNAHS